MQWMRRQLFIRTYDINKPDKEEIRGLDMNEQKELIIARLRGKRMPYHKAAAGTVGCYPK